MSDRGQGVESQIKELKVSGHMMTLDPGLYCVYNAPGGPAINEAGLPGVRITAAPASGSGEIIVSTFTSDGWIGSDSAALVRVSHGKAELMVTVYQSRDSKAEAPKLQVVQLSGEGAKSAASPASVAPQVAPQEPVAVEVVAHVYGVGDLAGRFGEWMSEPGSQRWIEGFGIAAPDGVAAADIEYQAVLGRGWLSPWSQGGQFCGSRGMSLPILGLRVRLRGNAAKSHRVALSASFVDGTRVGPVGDGEPCEAPSLAALEAFQIALEPTQDGKLPREEKPGRAVATKAAKPAKPVKAAPVAVAPEPVLEQPAKVKPGRKAAKVQVAPPSPEPQKLVRGKQAGKQKTAAPVAELPVVSKAGRSASAKVTPQASRAPKRTPATTRRR